MDDIRHSITSTLPTLGEADIDRIENGLSAFGVTEFVHLEVLKEDDLKEFVDLLVHRRLLLKAWSMEIERKRAIVTEENSTGSTEPAVPIVQNDYLLSFYTPTVDWSLVPSANLLNKKVLTIREEKEIIKDVVEAVMKSKNLKKNLSVQSWLHVAKQIGEKNKFGHFKQYPHLGTKAQPFGRLQLTLHGRGDYYCKQFALPDTAPHMFVAAAPAKKRKNSRQATEVYRVPEGEDENTINDKMIELQEMHKLSSEQWDDEKISHFMTLLFTKIKYVAQIVKPNVNDILHDFPFLLHMKYCMQHLYLLQQVHAEDAFKNFITTRLETTIKYLTRKSSSVDRCIPIEREMEHAENTNTSRTPRIVGLLNMIAQHLEKKSYQGVFLLAESTANFSEIEDKLELPAVTPTIIALGRTAFTAENFCVAACGKVVGKTSSITKAFSFYFAAFYALHATYPMHLATFMEFFQRYVFDISDGEDVAVTDRNRTLKPGRKQAFTQSPANLIAAIEEYHTTLTGLPPPLE